MASNDLTAACSDLCAWATAEGVPLFVIHTLEDGSVRFIGPQLPSHMVARMLRSAADGYERQVPERTMN